MNEHKKSGDNSGRKALQSTLGNIKFKSHSFFIQSLPLITEWKLIEKEKRPEMGKV